MWLLRLTVLLRVLKHHGQMVRVVALLSRLMLRIAAYSWSALIAVMSSVLLLQVSLTFIVCEILGFETTMRCMLCSFRLML